MAKNSKYDFLNRTEERQLLFCFLYSRIYLDIELVQTYCAYDALHAIAIVFCFSLEKHSPEVNITFLFH